MFAATARVMDGLRARYAEPHRAYHGQSHIDAMLAGLQSLAFTAPAAAELAVWFHDAIYDPAATDNEARSADLLLHDLTGLADPTLLHRAAVLIRATATHQLPTDLTADLAKDAALFLDLDMAILGAHPGAYDAYERGIAAEYIPSHGEARFRAGRLAFLQSMLTRPRLFLTDEAEARLATSARANITRAIGGLT